jgi:hypothetical protein
MNAPCAVVIGDHTQGLGIVRSAAAAGGRVVVVNDKTISLGRFSRHVSVYKRLRRGTLSCLAQKECADHLERTLLDLAFDGSAVLFGVNEDITRFIHERRPALRSRYLVPEVALNSIYDKFEFNRLAPEAARIDTRLLSEVALDSVREPHRFLLKGRCGNTFRQITGQKAVGLAQWDSRSMERLLGKMSPDQVVVQEIIETDRPIVSVCSFSINGQMAGLFGYEKIRQHPNRFGTGTYLRSVEVDRLLPTAHAILKRLEFTGVSEMEFIHDKQADAYRVIEMNPRTWKSVHFATQCGQNLVAQQLRYFAGQAVRANANYAKHQHWADLATDIPQMVRDKKIARYDQGFFECTWDPADPWPALVLWTMFPLIAVENWMHARVARREANVPGGSPRQTPFLKQAAVGNTARS